MSDEVTIRRAGPNDLQSLFSICRQAYTENFAHHWNEGGLEWYLDSVYSLKGIQSDLQKIDVAYFIASIKSEDAGFMKLNLRSNLPGLSPAEGMEIEKLYFRPQHQGKSIGKKLINVALETAIAHKKNVLWLGVIDTNEQAIGFYKKMGFAFHSKTTMDIHYFKDELKGMWRMSLTDLSR